jgi:uncharacterized protein YbjT (DUF2867 family)
VRSLRRAEEVIPGVERVEMHYERPETVAAAMEGISHVYLVTPSGSAQLEQTWVTLEAARQAGVRHVVRLGSLLPTAGLTFQIARWCRMTERMVESSGMDWTFLRPGWFHQNFTEYMFAPQVKMGAIFAPLGEGRAAWIDCRDIADVAIASLTQPGHEGQTYTLTGPEVQRFPDLVEIFSRALGRKIRYFNSPAFTQRFLARAFGLSGRDADAVIELLLQLRDNKLSEQSHDVEKVLGRPAIGFAQFAADHAASLR